MGYKTIDLRCPGCNASLNINDRKCSFCGRDILISNFNSVYSMPIQDINKYTNLYKRKPGLIPDFYFASYQSLP